MKKEFRVNGQELTRDRLYFKSIGYACVINEHLDGKLSACKIWSHSPECLAKEMLIVNNCIGVVKGSL